MSDSVAEAAPVRRPLRLKDYKPRWMQNLRQLVLKSSDGQEFVVDEDVAAKSNLLKKMMETQLSQSSRKNPVGPQEATERKEFEEKYKDQKLMLADPLPISQVTGPILEKIIQWCKDHRKDKYIYKEAHEDPRVWLTRYDEEYMDVDSETLVDLLLGADFMDVPCLIDVLTQKIANIGNGKSIEELREVYMLPDDMTEEQKEEVRKKYAWVNA